MIAKRSMVFSCVLCISWLAIANAQQKVSGLPLEGTAALTMEGDIAAEMVAGIDRFLLKEIELSVERREKFWKRDFSSPEAYNKSIEPNRERLSKILGVVDERVPFDAPEIIATTQTLARRAGEDNPAGTTGHPSAIARGENYEIFAVRWPAVRQVHGEGLLLVPNGEKVADIIAIPDADQTPEQICGLAVDVPAESQFARRLAENGCRVLVPTLISREMSKRAPPGMPGRANLTNREYVYRPAFELGRHIIGYELQKVLAGVDWFVKDAGGASPKIGVIGYGEGGMLALYAKAIDRRVTASAVSGYFGSKKGSWSEPIDRNVFGLLNGFGNSDVASMASPGTLIVEMTNGPHLQLPSEGGAPVEFKSLWLTALFEFQEAEKVFEPTGLPRSGWVRNGISLSFRGGGGAEYKFGNEDRVADLIESATGNRPNRVRISDRLPDRLAPYTPIATRQQRQVDEIVRDTQLLLRESPYVRQKFMKKLSDTKTVEEYEKVAEEYREVFAKEVIGQFDYPLETPKPRSRKSYETEKWVGYEMMLDVLSNRGPQASPDVPAEVFAYGILCLPKDLKPGEKRPVVVCQHGLEGRPQDVIGEQRQDVYAAFAGKLAERGFITFSPQNIYIGKDNFRTLQRKANPLGKTLFSIMVPQHQQICNWLKSLPFVDGERIGFYGLSYGGKSAMRIPPLVKDYCLSICSADFNDWVDKNASTRAPYSYVWSPEYEIFEWDLGSTFNYAEMAALIAPRPFMVERGHFDGVGVDERVASEYAKVQRIYNVQLKMPDRCQIEYFVGPHKINGVGTFEFLHKHLRWPQPD